MNSDTTTKNKSIYLHPGQYYVTRENVEITTLLGSCVAVCLFDPVNHIMGMNHFLLSNRRYVKSGRLCISDAGRYGIHAMEIIINEMLKLGAKKSLIKAKAFGGGTVLKVKYDSTNFPIVGEVNVRFIREFLYNENIPLISSDLGGVQGRKIRFDGTDYSVFVKKIEAVDSSLIKQEKRLWTSGIQKHEKESTDIELWR